MKGKRDIGIQTGANTGHKEKKEMLLLGPREQQIIDITISGVLGEFTMQRSGLKLLQKETWSISNRCLVVFDDCELDKPPGLCAAIKTPLLSTSSVSVAADSLKRTSSNRILLSPGCLGKTATQLLHTFCRGNQRCLAAASCPAVA